MRWLKPTQGLKSFFSCPNHYDMSSGAHPKLSSKAEDELKITPNSQCALNALAIDEPMEYVRLVLDGEMQAWIDAEDSLEVW